MVPVVYFESKESVSATSSVIWLPLIALITRSVSIREPAFIQVCAVPLRTRFPMPIKSIHAWVTKRRTKTVSPTAKPAEEFTLKVLVPSGTYVSVMVAVFPVVW